MLHATSSNMLNLRMRGVRCSFRTALAVQISCIPSPATAKLVDTWAHLREFQPHKSARMLASY